VRPAHVRVDAIPSVSHPVRGVAGARKQVRPVQVPWSVHRSERRGALEFTNTGAEPLRAVRVSLAGGGLLGLTLPRTVYPGESFRVAIRGVAAQTLGAPDAVLVLRWFDPKGGELLWPVAL